MTMSRDLTNHVIIITGASSGIGAATARACAAAGMDVVLNARRADRLEAVASDVRACGRRAITVVGDVVEPDLSRRLLEAATATFGRFDAVFANAGIGTEGTIAALPDEAFRRMFDVNFHASVDLVRAAARRMLADGTTGHLLMCSSSLAKIALPGGGVYCATKAAQNVICRAMRMELAPEGIHVSSVHPIGTATEFFEASASYAAAAGVSTSPFKPPPRILLQSPDRVARAIVRQLRRRHPRPEVWTCWPLRLLAAVSGVSPRLQDAVIRRVVTW
ncbi:MAG: SDR family oxidoreductase [Phycisphaerales bacterium]|nr:SDR family oxidoreductase [Phycisphaerales bacterium]